MRTIEIQNYLESCVKVQFLIDDLRKVSDYIGTNEITELKKNYWVRQHFHGGFSAPKDIASGRAPNNESSSNLGFCIRSDVQESGLGLGNKTPTGLDIMSLRVLNVLRENGDTEIKKEYFSKKSPTPFRCEHTEEVSDLRDVIIDKTLNTNEFGDIRSTALFLLDNHLACAILESEDKASGTQSKIGQHSYRQPFRRYLGAGSVILMRTGIKGENSMINVTHSTKEEIVNLRKNNPKHKFMEEGIQRFTGFDQIYLTSRREDFHADRASTKNKGRSSSYYPELSEKNLQIIKRNDPVELCKEFYTWKIK